MTGRLDGKISIVTGAGSGIGRGVARRLATEGAVVIVNDLNPEAAAKTVDLIAAAGDIAEPHAGDVTQSWFVDELVNRAVDRHGRLDVMHNNAGGVFDNALITETADEDWDRTIALNLTAAFYGIRAALRVMIPRATGSIISTSSLSGLGGTARSGAYSAAKAGIIHLTRNAAVEWAKTGVRINSVAPGTMHTPALEAWMDLNVPSGMEAWARQIPQGRLGQPSDIAGVVVFLASDDAAFVNGQTIACDGGVTAKLGGPHAE